MPDLVVVDRIALKADATLSQVYVQGQPLFKMLEDVVRPAGQHVKNETAIDAGRYPLGLRHSPAFSDSYYTKDDLHLIPRDEWKKLTLAQQALYHEHDTIWVMGKVKDWFVLHHWGNTNIDTRACGLIGTSFGLLKIKNPERAGKVMMMTAVLASRTAYVKYYALVAPLIRAGGQFVEYRNSF
jgi:hypothetical protein